MAESSTMRDIWFRLYIARFFLSVLLLGAVISRAACGDLSVAECSRDTDLFQVNPSACLFIEQPIHSLNKPREELTVLQQIAAKVTEGIVSANAASTSLAGFGESMVDLQTLISNCIDKEFSAGESNSDAYWEYYASCDRWDVVFAAATNLHPEPYRISQRTGRISPVAKSDSDSLIDSLQDLYLKLEFAVIESSPTGKLVRNRSAVSETGLFHSLTGVGGLLRAADIPILAAAVKIHDQVKADTSSRGNFFFARFVEWFDDSVSVIRRQPR